MVQDAVKMAESELSEYPLIDKYLGRIIRRRLNLSCPEKGVLIAELLDDEDESKQRLRHLEDVLCLGDQLCENFGDVFKSGLPEDARDADARILDLLAEIEAFDYLYRNAFTKIAHILRTPANPTPEFTALRHGYCYAVEVKRPHIPQSECKKVKPFVRKGIISGFASGDAHGPLVATFKDVVKDAHKQIEGFCLAENEYYRGIVIMSAGLGFVGSLGLTRGVFSVLRNKPYKNAICQTWGELKEGSNCPYLQHIVFLRKRASEFIVPNLD